MDTKNIILDLPFKGDIRLPLSKGETILWEGAPIYNKGVDREKLYPNLPQTLYFRVRDYFIFVIFLYLFMLSFALPTGTMNPEMFGGTLAATIVFSILMLLPELYKIFKRKNFTSYILTSKQMIFKFGEKGNEQLHTLPLNQIRNVTINKNSYHPKCGYVVFHLNKNYPLSFQTYDLFSGEMHSKLTLTMIENVGEVFTLLQSTISKSKRT